MANDPNPSNTTPVSVISFFKPGWNEDAAVFPPTEIVEGVTAKSVADDVDWHPSTIVPGMFFNSNFGGVNSPL